MLKETWIDRAGDLLFRPRFVKFATFGGGCVVKRRCLRQPYLLFVRKGTGELKVDGKVYPIMPDKLFLLLPGQVAEAWVRPGDAVQAYVSCFRCSDTGDATALWSEDVDLAVSVASAIDGLLEQIVVLSKSPHRLKRWKRTLLFQELIYTIVSDVSEPDRDSKLGSVMEHVLNYINDHYHVEDLSVRSIATLHGISPSNFAGLFKKHTGATPVEYLTRLRIEKAKEALVPSRRVADIARKVGYRDELYFSRSFKKVVGVAPTLYMKRHSAESIMAIDPILTDYLLALDVEPVASVSYDGGGHIDGRLPFLADRLEHVRLVGTYRQPDWKKAMEVSPRLVLGIQQHNGAYAARLSQIAPTVLISLQNDWRSLLDEVARLTERADRSKAWQRQYDNKAAEARKRLADTIGPDRTALVLVATAYGPRVYGGKRQLGELLYKDLGLKPPRGIRMDEHYRGIGPEELRSLDPEYIFLTVLNWGPCQEQKQLLKESEIWKSLRAVRANRAFEVDSWLNNHAPLSRSAALDRVLAYLLNAGTDTILSI